jgi:hypothetical protein
MRSSSKPGTLLRKRRPLSLGQSTTALPSSKYLDKLIVLSVVFRRIMLSRNAFLRCQSRSSLANRLGTPVGTFARERSFPPLPNAGSRVSDHPFRTVQRRPKAGSLARRSRYRMPSDERGPAVARPADADPDIRGVARARLPGQL